MSDALPDTPYFKAPHGGPDCSTSRSAALRERRFAMGYVPLSEPEAYRLLAADAADALRRHADVHPARARAEAMAVVVRDCPMTPEKNAILIGGEDPFLFNAMLPALHADRYEHALSAMPVKAETAALRDRCIVFCAPCFEGHITPGLEFILDRGTDGLRRRLREARQTVDPADHDRDAWLAAALQSCDNIDCYAERCRLDAEARARETTDSEWAEQLREAAATLRTVPKLPATTFREALQAYWTVYILVTIEMGGCMPGGGLGIGRPDQYLLPYYQRDVAAGRLTRAEALELLEIFLLNFRHVDYHTPHQTYTPGSQASIGGITPDGSDASNDLTELIMEASLRIQMPTPYISLRLHANAPERYWQAAANFAAGGLGFSIVNDEVLIPAFLKHGRRVRDARDYICSCCYEFTIPGKEAFNPNGCYINLPFILELTLNDGCSLLDGARIAEAEPRPAELRSFADLMERFYARLARVLRAATRFVNAADALRMASRHMPMMSLFIDDCIEKATDVAAGGARYNLTGMIVSGLPNAVNSLAAIREVVFERAEATPAELLEALHNDFAGAGDLRQALLRAPKWGNGNPAVDGLAREISDRIYAHMSHARNARGGRWQVALYSFVANVHLGTVVGAGADGRRARSPLTRNLNPSWGTDTAGPTAVLRSLSAIDFTQFPNGGTLDLRFDPAPFIRAAGREALAAFLKGFVNLKVMQMQLTMVDTETLLDARKHPERWPDLMVKVAGYSARFVDLPEEEKDEIIGRSRQRIG